MKNRIAGGSTRGAGGFQPQRRRALLHHIWADSGVGRTADIPAPQKPFSGNKNGTGPQQRAACEGLFLLGSPEPHCWVRVNICLEILLHQDGQHNLRGRSHEFLQGKDQKGAQIQPHEPHLRGRPHGLNACKLGLRAE